MEMATNRLHILIHNIHFFLNRVNGYYAYKDIRIVPRSKEDYSTKCFSGGLALPADPLAKCLCTNV